tara:strand:- start:3683 stop:4531 length:849 start_codon:yes stop_codon:yes gene_type:complete
MISRARRAAAKSRAPVGNYLNIILLPLDNSEEHIYISNLEEILNSKKEIDKVQLFHYHTIHSRTDTLDNIASSIEAKTADYPDSPLPTVSKKDLNWFKFTFLSYFTGGVPVAKYATSVSTNMAGAGAIAGGITGAVIGSTLGGIASNSAGGGIAGMVLGAILGGLAPLIYTGAPVAKTVFSKWDVEALNKRNEAYRIKIPELANKVRYETIPITDKILPDFLNDNIRPYLSPAPTFTPPTKGHSLQWVYDSFKEVLEMPSVVAKMTSNIQRYYFTKVEVQKL